jgi:hypothetical protein
VIWTDLRCLRLRYDFKVQSLRNVLTSKSYDLKSSLHKQGSFSSIRQLSYQHTRLNATKPIRLLKLLKGTQDEPIKVQFTAAYLRPTPSDYIAISYAWGDPTLKHEIECEGRTLGVTEHVQVRLRHLRDPEENKVHWIDALCINQADLEERSMQVRLMGQIYETANKVTI